MPVSLPPIESLVPHRPPMLLLDAVTSHAETSIECTVTPRADGLFNEGGTVPNVIAIEYMAQAVAALAGLQHHQAGQAPRIGYLIGSRQLVLHVEHFRVGEALSVHAQSIWQDRQSAQFECRVQRGAACLAEATLTVYEPPLPDGTQA
jgi:predicted hotdog family 3-hydroxylacyl-ACP dehydratase